MIYLRYTQALSKHSSALRLYRGFFVPPFLAKRLQSVARGCTSLGMVLGSGNAPADCVSESSIPTFTGGFKSQNTGGIMPNTSRAQTEPRNESNNNYSMTVTTSGGVLGIATLSIDFTGFSVDYMQSRRTALLEALRNAVASVRAIARDASAYQPQNRPILGFSSPKRDEAPATFGLLVDAIALSDDELELQADHLMDVLVRQFKSCDWDHEQHNRAGV